MTFKKIMIFILESIVMGVIALLICFGLMHRGNLFGVEYTLSDDGTYYILSDYGAWNFNYKFVVPEEWNGKPVYEIGENAFLHSHLKSVVISEGVKKIKSRAFFNCLSLQNIVIPDSIETIESSAFSGVKKLKNIDVGENNKTYKSIDGNLYTKDGKTLIKYSPGKTDKIFVIPDGVEIVGDGNQAFSWCGYLTGVVVPSSVNSFSARFDVCDKLSHIYYAGTQEEWKLIKLESFYDSTAINIYYYSEKKPENNENHWHYDNNGNIVLWE